MSEREVVRAWKDRRYRSRLGEGELAALPAHPAGAVELADTKMSQVAAGSTLITCIVGLTCNATLNPEFCPTLISACWCGEG